MPLLQGKKRTLIPLLQDAIAARHKKNADAIAARHKKNADAIAARHKKNAGSSEKGQAGQQSEQMQSKHMAASMRLSARSWRCRLSFCSKAAAHASNDL